MRPRKSSTDILCEGSSKAGAISIFSRSFLEKIENPYTHRHKSPHEMSGLSRTPTLSHEPVPQPTYNFTDAEVFAYADAQDKAEVTYEEARAAEDEAKAADETPAAVARQQNALRSIFKRIRGKPAFPQATMAPVEPVAESVDQFNAMIASLVSLADIAALNPNAPRLFALPLEPTESLLPAHEVTVEDARRLLEEADANFTMANAEVRRAHTMNGPNVQIHVDAAVRYREESCRRLLSAEDAYSAALRRQA